MGTFAKFNATGTLVLGPFLDIADGITPLTGLSPQLRISKHGNAFVAGPTGTHMENGFYTFSIGTSDVSLVGRYIFAVINSATHLPVWHEVTINNQNVYDSLFNAAGQDLLDVQVAGFDANVIDAAAIANAAIDSATFANDTGLGSLNSGTAQAGAATTITLAAGASSVDEFYTGATIVTTGGSGQLQHRIITAYNGTSKVATVNTAWATNPSSGTAYAIRGAGFASGGSGGPSAADIADAVWDEDVVTAHNAVDTAGKLLSDAMGLTGSTGVTLAAGAITAAKFAAQAITNGAFQTGAIDSSVLASGAITSAKFAAGAINAAALNADIGLHLTSGVGQAQGGGATTITLATTALADNDFYQGHRIVLTGGTGAGQSRIISSYVGATKVATISAGWLLAPDSTTTYAIFAANVDVEHWRRQLPNILTTGRVDTTVGAMQSNVLNAAAIASSAFSAAKFATDAITGIKIAADAVAKIADGVWDEEVTTGHSIANSAGILLANETGYTGRFVYADTVGGTAGTTANVHGTQRTPTNSLANAKTIADALGIKDIIFYGTFLNAAVVPASSNTLHFWGRNNAWIGANSQTVGSVREATLQTSTYGSGEYVDCNIPSFIDINITAGPKFTRCHWEGESSVTSVQSGGERFFIDCLFGKSLVTHFFHTGDAVQEILHFNGCRGAIEIRNLGVSGAPDIVNVSGRDHFHVILHSSCVGGTVNVTGAVQVTNNGSGITINRNNSFGTLEVADAVWDEDIEAAHGGAGSAGLLQRHSTGYDDNTIYVNTKTGTAGSTTNVHGTKKTPTNSLANAATLFTNTGIRNIKVYSEFPSFKATMVTGLFEAVLEGYDENSSIVMNSEFARSIKRFIVEGPIRAASFFDCYFPFSFTIVTGSTPEFIRSRFNAAITITISGNGFSATSCVFQNATILDFDAVSGGKLVHMQDVSGHIHLANFGAAGAGDVLNVHGNGLTITVLAGSTGGSINASGSVTVIQQGTGLTLNDNTFNGLLPGNIWSTAVPGSFTVGTAGHKLGSLTSSGGASASLNAVAIGFTPTTVIETNTYTNTHAQDGQDHILDDVGNVIDGYYEFQVGVDGLPVSVTTFANLDGSNDTINVFYRDWAGAQWIQMGTIPGSGTAAKALFGFSILDSFEAVGQGADAGKVRIRFATAAGASNPKLSIDSLFLGYAIQVPRLMFTGIADAGGASTITFPVNAVGLDDYYFPALIQTVGGTGAGQSRRVNSYVGSTRVATVATPWTVVPDNTTVFVVLPWASVRVSDIDTNPLNAIRDAILPPKNVAFSDISVLMLNATTKAPMTGLTLTVTRSIDGGSFVSATGTAAEVGNGIYQYDASAADMNGRVVTLRFAAAGADDTFLTVVTGG